MKLLGRDIPARELLARLEERLRARGLAPSEPTGARLDDEGVEPRVDPLSFNLAALEEHADATRGLPLETHRGGAGRVVLVAKWAFRRAGQVFINEALGRQRIFNGLVRDSYAQLAAEVLRLREEVARLKAERDAARAPAAATHAMAPAARATAPETRATAPDTRAAAPVPRTAAPAAAATGRAPVAKHPRKGATGPSTSREAPARKAAPRKATSRASAPRTATSRKAAPRAGGTSRKATPAGAAHGDTAPAAAASTGSAAGTPGRAPGGRRSPARKRRQP